MDLQIQTFQDENSNGELMYTIKVNYLNCFTCWNFIFSIEIGFDNYPKIRKAIEELTCTEVTLKAKLKAIQLILSLVEATEMINNFEISELFNGEELNAKFIFPKFLFELALQFSPEQLATLSNFKKKINRKKFLKSFPIDLN